MARRFGARRANRLGMMVGVVLAVACSKDPPPPSDQPAEEPSAKPQASASGAASAVAKDGPPVCKVAQEKRWNRWVNTDAGLTFTPLDNGRLAFGVADGEKPRVLLFSRLGTGSLIEVPIAEDSPLSEELPMSQGRRKMLRVTPSLDPQRGVTAHVDYRDELSEGKRRVACVPAHTHQGRLSFDGEPLIQDGKMAGLAGLVADAGTDTPEVVREVRDCRTFVNPGGTRAWGVGSRLRMEKLPNRSLKWSWQLFIDPGAELPQVVLKSQAFEAMPGALPDFELLAGQRLVDRTYLVAAREQEKLWLWGLDSAHQIRGEPKSYEGGAPSAAGFFQDGAEWRLLLTRAVEKQSALASAKLAGASPALPAELGKLPLPGLGPSLGGASLARIKEQRWLAFHAGEPGDRKLMVIAVDENLKPTGAPFPVSAPEESVHSSHLVALENGDLLIVYVQHGAPGADLYSKRLTCWVR